MIKSSCVVSPVKEKKVYGEKDLPKSQVLKVVKMTNCHVW